MRPQKNRGGMSETVLWTNTNPTSYFVTTNVTLSESLANFKAIKFVYKQYSDVVTDVTQSIVILMDDFKRFTSANPNLPLYLCAINNGYKGYRQITYVSDTSITISGGLPFSASGTMNGVAIPLEVIGLK